MVTPEELIMLRYFLIHTNSMHIKIVRNKCLCGKNGLIKEQNGLNCSQFSSFSALKCVINYILLDFKSHWLLDASVIRRLVCMWLCILAGFPCKSSSFSLECLPYIIHCHRPQQWWPNRRYLGLSLPRRPYVSFSWRHLPPGMTTTGGATLC